MKRNRTKPLSMLILTIIASLCVLTPATHTYAQSTQLRRLVGEWEVSTKPEGNDKRLVSFVISNGRLNGTYVTQAGDRLPITGISYALGKYSFRVPDAQLVFKDFRFVGHNLEGIKIRTIPTKTLAEPRLVQMIRKVSH